MCELFFMQSKSGEPIRRERLRDLVLTAQQGSYTNSDGSGAFNRFGRVFRTEKPLHELDVPEVVNKLYGSEMVVFHVRASTRGSVCAENAHPFQKEKHVLAHNGTMRNLNDYGDGDITDSKRFLLKVIGQDKSNPVQNVKSALESTKGWLSIFYRDIEADETLYFRNKARFTFGETGNLVVGATNSDRLDFLENIRPNRHVHNRFEPDAGTIFRITDEIESVKDYQLGTDVTTTSYSTHYRSSYNHRTNVNRGSRPDERPRNMSKSQYERYKDMSYEDYREQKNAGNDPLEELYGDDDKNPEENVEMAEIPNGFYR